MTTVKPNRQLHRLYKNIHSMSDGQAIITDSDGENLWIRLEIRPNSGCYKGGRFEFMIILVENYPTVGPDVKCFTPIFHPNISSYELIYGYSDDADVCVSLLDDWTSSNTLEDCVQALLFLIHNPNLDDPLNPLFSPGQYDDQQFYELAQKSLRGEKVDGCLYPWNYHLEEETGSEEMIDQESRNSYKSVDQMNADRGPSPVDEAEIKDVQNMEESLDGEDVEWCPCPAGVNERKVVETIGSADLEESVDGEEEDVWNQHFVVTQNTEGITEEESDYKIEVVTVEGDSCLTNKENGVEYNEEEHNSLGRKTTESFYNAKVEYSQVTYSYGREESQHFYCEEVEHLPRAQLVIVIIDVEQVDQYMVEETFIQQGRNEMCIINVEANHNHQILECVDLSLIKQGNIYKCVFTLLANMISESIYSTAEDTKLQVLLEATAFKYKVLIIRRSVGSVCFTRSSEKSLLDKCSCAILLMHDETRIAWAQMLQCLKIEMDKGKGLIICNDSEDLVVTHASLWIQNKLTTKQSLSYTLLHKANFAIFEVFLSPNIIRTLILPGYLAAVLSTLFEAMGYNKSYVDTAVHSKPGNKANIVTMVTVLPLLERKSCVKQEPLHQTEQNSSESEQNMFMLPSAVVALSQ